MTDKELLEMAAKAAGYEGIVSEYLSGYVEMGLTNHFKPDGGNVWAPLTNDSDALRLAVKLFLWEAVRDGYQHVDSDTDFYAATRRAITRAAAEIGKAMP